MTIMKELIDFEPSSFEEEISQNIPTLAMQMGWKVHQIDVKISFLNGVVEEDIYIEKHEGFETFDKETHVCRLRRALI